ncbi:MAG: hypothetical protein ACRCXH_01975 [Shewanella sp.]|uniref:hypothetical protein n=1 Tax=Shewanella sp. TaxID=50422 RepID=UPI003F34F564
MAHKTIMVRVPNTPHRNFHHSQAANAKAYRDRLCQQLGIKLDAPKGRTLTQSYANKNSALPLGVCIINKRKVLADGTECIYRYAQGNMLINGKQHAKAFGFIKYGEGEAIRLAIEWRNSKQHG